MTETASAALMDNPHVQELLSMMQGHGADTSGVVVMINDVSAIERYMESANAQIAAMRRELAEMRDIQKHPIKTALQNTVKSLQSKLNAASERLGEVKSAIIEGCKKAVASLKENGKAALNGIMKFFHIKSGMEAIRDDLSLSIKADNQAIAKIEAFSQQYHETGKAVGNLGRVLFGRETIQEAKPVGKLARALEAPLKADRAINIKMRNAATKVIGRLEQLDADVTARRDEKAAAKTEKASVLGRLDENKERVARENLDRAVPERAKAPREATV